MLAEDHRTVREGLKLLLEIEGDIEVVAEVASGREAVQSAITARPQVILMDVTLVGMDGIEATRQIREKVPEAAVVMLSAHGELFVVRASLDAGALGYLLKRISGQELREAVRAAARGEAHFSQEVMRAVHERGRPGRGPAEPGRAHDPWTILTERELEVLQLVAQGRSNREIAELLKLSIKTVETHRMHVMEKLDIHDIAGLTRYALRKGLIDA